MSRRAIKAINWAALAERIPETERTMYSAFKTKSDQHFQRMNANPEAMPKIDWTYYKKNIPVAGLVDKFQKDYESITIPYPQDNYTSQVEEEEKRMIIKMKEFIQGSNERIANANQEIDKLKNLLPFSEMTMEDYRDYNPDSFNPEKPTVWPHTPEFQPENETGRPSDH